MFTAQRLSFAYLFLTTCLSVDHYRVLDMLGVLFFGHVVPACLDMFIFHVRLLWDSCTKTVEVSRFYFGIPLSVCPASRAINLCNF